MKFGLLHFRVFETDGVSLEMDKWRFALEKLGHEVVYISGHEVDRVDHIYLEELFYKAEYNKLIHRNAFKELIDFDDEQSLIKHINKIAQLIESKLEAIVKEHEIDVLVPNNVSSLGFNLPVGIAIGNLNKNEVVKFIYHHHDFYFERQRYSTPLFEGVREILEEYFPYKGKAIHCTINELAKEQLLKRKNIEAHVIPNVFDFNHKLWEIDEYNSDLRERLKIKENDIVFLQATRIVNRKGIELGYYIIEEFSKSLYKYIGKELYNGQIIKEDSKVHFVLAGLNEYEGDFNKLDKLINRSDIVVHYINDFVDHSRNYEENKKIYSLWDVYTMCDFITYPSVLEGWGNQLLEGLFAKKPLLVYEYPVFKSDIVNYGLELVTFYNDIVYDEEKKLLLLAESTRKNKAENIWNIILSKAEYKKMVEHNFSVGKKSLSYDALGVLIKNLLKNLI